MEGFSANQVGVYGQGDNLYGVMGVSANDRGVYGNGGAMGVYGTSPSGVGVYGLTASGGGGNSGVYGAATGSTGSGVYGYGVKVPGIQAGAGDGFAGAYLTFTPGTSTTGEAVCTYNSLSSAFVYVNQYDGITQWKISGTGSVGTVVKDTAGSQVRLICPEAPEIYFEDYGEGKLVNGKAHITLDATIAQNVIISEKHPLRVFIQLEDNENCNGVVIKNKTTSGFDVVELKSGTSNTPFQWHIICNRADEVNAVGKTISHNADIRFPKAKDDPKVSIPKLIKGKN